MTIFVLLILVSGCNSNDQNHSLRGTYVSKDLPRITMVFDQEDDNKFYYYDHDLPENQRVDKGNYSKKSNSNYVIKNTNFKETEITFKQDGFTVTINGNKYYFQQISSLPTIQK
ncbi:hypothetical protein [Bacillus sp. AFS029533]|uniref:hypothetical protein n=1 Tax=Bacillus sp. AFS029533 TaxID=2033494 RepID=UPI0004170B6F|nr:hypothetical protein [Bacillus sp. AFS029533]PGZ88566.1 hypothetical protein COE53_19680 [Bacillus sp. AFS029533]